MKGLLMSIKFEEECDDSTGASKKKVRLIVEDRDGGIEIRISPKAPHTVVQDQSHSVILTIEQTQKIISSLQKALNSTLIKHGV
jgi:hypothetical protein